MDRFVIVAGGPGAGKTTLIEHLAARGFATAPEAGRALIRQQRDLGREVGPDLWVELGLSWDIRNYREAETRSGPVFFDHAIPGTPAYYLRWRRPVPAHVEAAVRVFPYRREVFLAPPWPAIYRTDEERVQSWAEAVSVYESVQETYIRYGYRPVELPRTTVAERADFLLAHVIP